MDIKAMQAATREAVRKRFGRKRILESRAVPHFPVSVEREYVRVVNAYIGRLNGLIAAGIPADTVTARRRPNGRGGAAG